MNHGKFADEMKNATKVLGLLCFLLWLGSSVWIVSNRFTDFETIPKWYAAFGGEL